MSAKKKFYVIRNSNSDAGMGSLLSSVIGHLKIAEAQKRVPIIDWQFYNMLYTEKTSVLDSFNVWDYYFNPVSNYELQDLTISNDVVYTDGSHPTNMSFPWANLKSNLDVFRRYVNFNVPTTNFLNLGVNRLGIGSSTLGVHFRAGRGMRTEPGHPIQPTRSQIEKLIDSKMNTNVYDKIFFATDVEEELFYFQSRYGDVLVNFETAKFQAKESKSAMIPGDRILHKYLLGLEVLSEAYALSRTGFLIAGYSGVSQMAEIMRPQSSLAETELIHNGRLSGHRMIAQYQFRLKSKLPRILGGLK